MSMLSQGIALIRQLMIVAMFGFGRALDFYATLSAMMSISVILVSCVVESTFIGLLNERKASGGDENVYAGFFTYIRASAVMSVLVVIFLIVIYPVFSQPFTAGFSVAEKTEIDGLAFSFLPWAVLIIPFAALGACAKSAWRYRQFFSAELMITLISTGSIFLWHEQAENIALSYAYGYMVAVLYLGWSLRDLFCLNSAGSFPWRLFWNRFLRHIGSNQVGTLYTLSERFWFSYLPAGNIAALGVVQQLGMNLASLLNFRDAYLVPLLDLTNRPQKIVRLLCGIFLLSSAVTMFVMIAAQPISSMLFQYGKARSDDINLVATLLAIGMGGVLLSTLGTPIWRLLQLSNNYTPLVWLYLTNTFLTLAMGYVFIELWELGAVGMGIIGAINAMVAFLASTFYAYSFGARLNRNQLSMLFWSLVSFIVAGLISRIVMESFYGEEITKLFCGGLIYLSALTMYGILARKHLLPLLKGKGLWSV